MAECRGNRECRDRQGREQKGEQLIRQAKGIRVALVDGAGLTWWHAYQKKLVPTVLRSDLHFCEEIHDFILSPLFPQGTPT